MPSPSIAIPVAPTATAVKAQFAAAPSLESITRQMLAQAIAQTCPTLKIDLTRTQLAVPMPNGGWELQPFMQRVMDYLGSGTALDLSPVMRSPITSAMTRRTGSSPIKASWTCKTSKRPSRN